MATVDELVADARNYAGEARSGAMDLVQSAQSAIGGLGSVFSVTGPKFDQLKLSEISEEIPDFEQVSVVEEAAPSAPTGLLGMPSMTFGDAPVNTAEKPEFNMPVRPAQLHDFGEVPPEINSNLTFPDLPPELQGISIEAPVLVDRAVPEKPALMMPSFDAVAPDDLPAAPTDITEKFVAAFREKAPELTAVLEQQMHGMLLRVNPQFDVQMAAIEDRLSKYITGGTALSPAIEQSIYERTKDRALGEFKRTRDAAYNDAARRGFTLPNGVLNAAVNQARQGASDNLARASAEIAIKQAELEQQNLQFAVSTSMQLRQTMLSASLSYHQSLVSLNGLALNYATQLQQTMVQVYDISVKAFAARLDAYRAEAAVYEARLRGVQAVVEIYRAEISALETLSNIDNAKVNLYRSRIEALHAMARVYDSQIQAVLGQASVEKMKLELFGTKVQAYTTQAQAKEAEWRGFAAAVNGEESKIRAYSAQINAYGSEVEAWSRRISAEESRVRSYSDYNRTLLAQYTSAVEAFRAKVSANAQVASTKLENQRVRLLSYNALMNAQEANARLGLGYYQAKAQINNAQFQTVLQTTMESAKLQTQQIEAVANTAIQGGSVMTSLAGAALSGMNTLVATSKSE